MKHKNYELITRMTAKFLDAYLKNDTGARNELRDPAVSNEIDADEIIAKYERATTPVLTPTEFLSYVRFGDMARVREAWTNESQKKLIPSNNFFSVVLFLSRDGEPHAYDAFDLYMQQYPNEARNRMLYDFLGGSLIKSNPLKAVEVYKHYTRQFPDSPHAYDKLAEAHMASHNVSDARTANAKILELLPASNLSEEEKRILQQRAKGRFR